MDFGVTPAKETELLRRMKACGLREADLEENFVRAGGPGGQKVNKSATCVQLQHKPTGTEVKMQKARSQALNRFYARRRMCELLEEKQGMPSKESRRVEKLRKQKARRRRKSSRKYEEGGGE